MTFDLQIPSEASPYDPNDSKSTVTRLLDVLSRTFDLGFTGFGGPSVHYQIFHRRFVDGLGETPWIDEHTYQAVFALSQSLPGPASTKMIFLISQIYAGLIPGFLVFFLWTLPGATAMYGLSLGVQRLDEVLPGPVYALLSGLNAATVGIIALSAIQLARRAVTDQWTRVLVLFGGGASLCYSAIWYSPALLAFAAVATLIWDTGGDILRSAWRNMRRRRSMNPLEPETEFLIPTTNILKTSPSAESIGADRGLASSPSGSEGSSQTTQPFDDSDDVPPHTLPLKTALILIGLFIAFFTLVMILRGTISDPPLLFSLFNNIFLAGTIVFGGGTVIIALLRDYVVQPGWVSPRDFLLGLAVIQALPGASSNFSVYLGAMVLAGPASTKSVPTIVGALVGYIGIFTPCLWLAVGFQSLWQSFKKNGEVMSVLRGINATAVGFVFAAVYRLWKSGHLSATEHGGSLGQEPWWVVVAAATFTAVEWFSVPPPAAILAGGVAGLGWWVAVGRFLVDQPSFGRSFFSVVIPGV